MRWISSRRWGPVRGSLKLIDKVLPLGPSPSAVPATESTSPTPLSQSEAAADASRAAWLKKVDWRGPPLAELLSCAISRSVLGVNSGSAAQPQLNSSAVLNQVLQTSPLARRRNVDRRIPGVSCRDQRTRRRLYVLLGPRLRSDRGKNIEERRRELGEESANARKRMIRMFLAEKGACSEEAHK